MVTKPPRNRSKTYDRAMWLFRLAELNCVRTKIRSRPELMQFEIGTSTRRYLPANGTAGFERWPVSGKSRVPAPPPRMTAIARFIERVGEGRLTMDSTLACAGPGRKGEASERALGAAVALAGSAPAARPPGVSAREPCPQLLDPPRRVGIDDANLDR